MTLKALIIDDESAACNALEALLKQFCPVFDEVYSCEDPEAGYDLISQIKPDILFLDINMPILSGFDFLEKLTGFKGKIVFVTAYDQYALKAFQYGAYDYLLKPIQISLLEDMVNRFVEERKDAPDNSELIELFHKLNKRENQLSSIAVNHRGGMQFIQTDDILFLKGQGNYTEVVCKDFTYMSTKTLKDFESILDDKKFIRTHKSYLVNIKSVSRFQVIDGAWYLIVNGIELPVSRRRKHIIDQFSV